MPMKMVDATMSSFDQVFEKFRSEAPNHQVNFILFLADKDPSTSLSWCPDCVKAEPVIYKKLEALSSDVALLRAFVGDRPTWRNPHHPWRVDSKFKLKGVPTLVRWENETINGRLEDNEAHLEDKIDALITGMQFPVISMKLLEEENPGEEMNRLARACQEWGYFQLVDHGVPIETMDALAKSLKAFFELPPQAEVSKIGAEESTIKPVYDNKGVPLLNMRKLGYNKKGVAVFQVKDHYSEPPENPQPEGWVQQLLLPCYPIVGDREECWPEQPVGLREKIAEYALEMRRLGEKLLRCFAVTLGLKPDAFVDAFGGRDFSALMMIVNCMPAVPPGGSPLTAPRHRDIGGVTMLQVVDGRQGLQVLKDGQWRSVPWTDPHALAVNMGDLMQVISNGRYESVLHRAVNWGDTMRMSIASVFNPDRCKEIGPVAELIDEQNPRLYGEGRHVDFLDANKVKPMTCFEYFSSRKC